MELVVGGSVINGAIPSSFYPKYVKINALPLVFFCNNTKNIIFEEL